MYCGSNTTALENQKLIGDAFLKLLKHTPFEEISISSICNEAGVSRQTFYSLFQTKENVIRYELERKCCYDCDQPDHSGNALISLSEHYSTYILDNRELLQLLYQNHLLGVLEEMQYQDFMNCPDFMEQLRPSERSYFACFVAGGLSSITSCYLSSGASASREFLAEMIRSLFSGNYLNS